MKKKILITGSKGFIGLAFLRLLDKSKYEILAIGKNKEEDLNLKLDSSSLENSFLKEKVAEFFPDVVFHFASGSSIMTANKNKDEEYEYACLGTGSFVKMLTSLKVKPLIVYLSSQAVYGTPKYLPVDEIHDTLPTTIYGKNKLESERILLKSGLKYLIFRVSSVYGPSQDPNKSGVVTKFISRILNNQSPVVFNDFELFGDFIYVDDVAEVLVKTLTGGFALTNQIYNLGLGKPVTLRNILNILFKYFPDAPKPMLEVNNLYPAKKEESIYLNTMKLQKHLKWEARFNLEEGLRLTIEKTLVKVPRT